MWWCCLQKDARHGRSKVRLLCFVVVCGCGSRTLAGAPSSCVRGNLNCGPCLPVGPDVDHQSLSRLQVQQHQDLPSFTVLRRDYLRVRRVLYRFLTSTHIHTKLSVLVATFCGLVFITAQEEADASKVGKQPSVAISVFSKGLAKNLQSRRQSCHLVRAVSRWRRVRPLLQNTRKSLFHGWRWRRIVQSLTWDLMSWATRRRSRKHQRGGSSEERPLMQRLPQKQRRMRARSRRAEPFKVHTASHLHS